MEKIKELYEETRSQKTEEKLRIFQDNFNRSTIRIIGVPEREEEEQEIENLFEKIMKKNFPNLTKEIDFQEVQEVTIARGEWGGDSGERGL